LIEWDKEDKLFDAVLHFPLLLVALRKQRLMCTSFSRGGTIFAEGEDPELAKGVEGIIHLAFH
jgi:hypothetical protein